MAASLTTVGPFTSRVYTVLRPILRTWEDRREKDQTRMMTRGVKRPQFIVRRTSCDCGDNQVGSVDDATHSHPQNYCVYACITAVLPISQH